MDKVLVIIVTYNGMKWADHCFGSLRSSSVPLDVVMIDNGSTDGTVAYVSEIFPEVKIIQSHENLGFGKANNVGMQIALDKGYDYVYLLNQDAWIMPDTIATLIKVQKKNPEYGVLSPMQMEENMRYFDRNFAVNVLGNSQCVSPCCLSDMYRGQMQDVYDVKFVMAAHWLISKDCLFKVGGFSPTFPHYGEDDNYLQRVNYWKMKVGIVPLAQAVHNRENREESEEKLIYITKYVQVLIVVSRPGHRVALKRFIKAYLQAGILYGVKWARRYAFRLMKERKGINYNYQCSLKQGAFLKH